MDEPTQESTAAHTHVATEPVAPAVDAHERGGTVHSTGIMRELASERGVTWMRISDAIASGSGKIAGRGLNLEVDLARRIHRQHAVTRHAIRKRTHLLPPLSEFGGGDRLVRSVVRNALNRS